MLILPIRDYEHFKQMFVRRVGDQRLVFNKPLLAFYRSKLGFELCKWYNVPDLQTLMTMFEARLRMPYCSEDSKVSDLMDAYYPSTGRWTDGQKGICLDGDILSIRYITIDKNGREKAYKTKCGKYFRKLIDDNPNTSSFPEEVKIHYIENICIKWKAFAAEQQEDQYELIVDKNFADIYDSDCCAGEVDSCMMDDDQYFFYNHIDCNAAYLKKNGLIYCRAILFNNVIDENGRAWRLLERQYAADDSNLLKQIFIDKLIKAGLIDGYKKINACCSDSRMFVSAVNDESLSQKRFRIDLDDFDPSEDVISYQDSFKWVDESNIAYNYQPSRYEFNLSTTSDRLFCDYDSYRNCWTEREMYSAIYDGESISISENSLEDFVYCDNVGKYVHEDEVSYCPECGDAFYDGGHNYSEILDKSFCCRGCLADAEYKAHKDNEEAA